MWYSWPTLTNPTIIHLPQLVTSTILLTPGTDYIIVGPGQTMNVSPTVDSAIAIDGQNPDGTLPPSNFVVINADIEFIDWGIPGAIPTENAGNGITTQSGRTIAIYRHRGTGHFEGIWAHGWGLAEGWDSFSNFGSYVVQYCRFGDVANPIQNRTIGVAGFPTIHPDGFSIAQGAGVKINQCDVWGAYQMFFCRNNALTTQQINSEIHDTQLNMCQVTGLTPTCTAWDTLNQTLVPALRDSMTAYSVQTSVAPQVHAAQYNSATSFTGALATYKCDTTPTLVRGLGDAINTTAGAASVVCATTQTVTAGDTIIASVTWRGNQTLSSVSGGGLAWTIDVQTTDTTEGWGVAVARAAAPSGLASATSITATLSGTTATAKSIMLGEFSGLGATPLDQTQFGGNGASHSTGFALPATSDTSQDLELVVSVWTAGFSPGGTLQPGPLHPPNPAYAAQVVWLENTGAPFYQNTVLLDNVWVNPGTVPNALNVHVHPSANDPTLAPSVDGSGNVYWPLALNTGYYGPGGTDGKVMLGPHSGDFTRAGGTTGGPGASYYPRSGMAAAWAV